jgi:hypothetical protein
MGMRRRTRRRALVAGAAVGHHMAKKNAEAQQAPADYQDQAQAAPPAEQPAQYAPPPADPTDQIEHLAQLHASGALTDDEFAAAKSKALGI